MVDVKSLPGGRPTSVLVKAGMMFGHLKIVQRGRLKGKPVWITECQVVGKDGKLCRQREKVPTAYLTRPKHPKRSCGCNLYADTNPWPREKGIWQMMHMRTEDPNHISYKHYGGRGIKVCAEWNRTNPQGWLNFIQFIGPAPSKSHSIDRVDPNLGYQPFQADGVTRQVRWATAKQQANNKRPQV